MDFRSNYTELGEHFATPSKPEPFPGTQLLLWNRDLAEKIGFESFNGLEQGVLAEYFSGQQAIQNVEPVALAYAGHQFGQFNPSMGDGRAHLLGAIHHQDKAYDIQLKGSGQTVFGRRGDGHCALKPALREYLMSEALHYLGVRTTRSLSVVTTGQRVYRRGAQQGAVVSRVAESHIRFASFQFLAHINDLEGLRLLRDKAIDLHYPEIDKLDLSDDDRSMAFFKAVEKAQMALVVDWMRVGFIHGVMNTDNMLVSGETIDYGPCSMMNRYHPETVYSSIDEQGRYAFGRQPSILNWNLARLAEALLALSVEGSNQSLFDQFNDELRSFNDRFDSLYLLMLSKKIGLREPQRELVAELLTVMQENELDYNDTFSSISRKDTATLRDLLPSLESWLHEWQAELEKQGVELLDAQQRMQKVNPSIVPRNLWVEEALDQFSESNDPSAFNELLEQMKSCYSASEISGQFAGYPLELEQGYQTFCGT